jgi:hypothetical protein
MDKVKVRVTIGMAEAVRAGKSEYGRKVVEINPVEFSPEEREVFLKLPCTYYGDANIPDLNKAEGIPSGIDGSFDDIRRLLAANAIVQAKEAEAKAIEDAKAKAKLEGDAAWALATGLDEFCERPMQQSRYRVSQQLANLRDVSQETKWRYEAALAHCQRKNDELAAEEKAQQDARDKAKADEEAKAEAKAQAKREFISTWVNSHGSESQKARLAAGLLPSKEIEDVLRDDCFAEIDRKWPARYARMDHDDVCSERDCDPEETNFTVEDSTEATDEEFRDLEAIKGFVRGRDAKCVLRSHKGECRCSVHEKKSILVTMNCGPFCFSREYAV